MKKFVFALVLILNLIVLPRDIFAADALYRMLHADEVESFQVDQDALIVGEIISDNDLFFRVQVLKILSGKVSSDQIRVAKDFTYGWDKEDPRVKDFAVFSLKESGLGYKKAWGIFKADQGDFRTLKLDPRNAPSPGLFGDLACIEWYVNSGGIDKDFSFQNNSNGLNIYVNSGNGDSILIYPKGAGATSPSPEVIAQGGSTGEDNRITNYSTVGTVNKALSMRLEDGVGAFLFYLIGWPGMITALVLSVLGLILRRPLIIVFGALFAMPISLYLSATPRFQYIMAGLPLFQLASAYVLHKNKARWIGWLLLMPFTLLVLWLGISVFS